MRVDLNGTDGSDLSGIQQQQKNPPSNAATGPDLEIQVGEDTATLSSDSTRIKSLTAKALETIEVRQDKVEALRQAVQNGEYKIEPSKIAEAMIQQSK